jgi:type I restriction enzyme M protein
MANGSLSSNSGGEGEIRRKIVEADMVDCIVALPAQLFFTTGIPVCLWFLTRDKTGRNIRRGTPNRPGGRAGETLFIDARKLGTMQTRVLRVLTGIEEAECVPGTNDPLPASDVGRIVYAYRRWRGEPPPDWWNDEERGVWAFAPTPGFAAPATLAEIAKHGHVLTPGRYVGAQEQEDDAEPFSEKYPRLVAELEEQLANGELLTNLIRQRLAEVREGE